MKYRFSKGLKLTDNCLKILGHGNQGTVFKLGNSALKVPNLGTSKRNDDEIEVATRLSKLSLKHFITPYKLKNRNKCFSFQMRVLSPDKQRKITDMEIDELVRNLKEIRPEVKMISNQGIRISDLQIHNICIDRDNSIQIFDFSDYSILDSPCLEKLNDSDIDTFFGSLILMAELPEVDPIYLYDTVYSDYLKSDDETIEDYYERCIKNGSISQYVRSKFKNDTKHAHK